MTDVGAEVAWVSMWRLTLDFGLIEAPAPTLCIKTNELPIENEGDIGDPASTSAFSKQRFEEMVMRRRVDCVSSFGEQILPEGSVNTTEETRSGGWEGSSGGGMEVRTSTQRLVVGLGQDSKSSGLSKTLRKEPVDSPIANDDFGDTESTSPSIEARVALEIAVR
jgi:hypothetical protein